MKKPKILHLLNQLSPLSIPFEIAEHLDQTRFDIELLSYYESNEELKSKLGTFTQKVRSVGAKRKVDIRAIVNLYRTLNKIRPDVLHVHHNLSGSIGRVIGKLIKIPIIIDTEHNDRTSVNLIGGLANGLTLPLSDVIICNSEKTKNSFFQWENRLISQNKKVVVYNGVDIREIDSNKGNLNEMRKALGFRPNDFLICNVGMMRKEKDQYTLITAMKYIANEIHNAKLVIVGNGRLQPKLKKLVQRIGVKEKVVFTGLIDRNTVYKILHAIDVFVMTSLGEGFCNAVVEAMAASKPVIVTRIDTFREIVDNAGEYVPLRDPKAVAEAVIELKNDSEKAKALGKAARKKVEEKFSIQRCVKKYEKIYHELLDRKSMKL